MKFAINFFSSKYWGRYIYIYLKLVFEILVCNLIQQNEVLEISAEI